MNIRINIEGEEKIYKLLESKQKLINNATRNTQVLHGVGQVLAAQGKENLEQGGTGTVSYKLLKTATQKRKRKRGQSMKPLQGEGLLKQSLDYEVENGDLYLTAVNYAKYHQKGGEIIPRRPIYSLEKDNLKDIQYLILQHISTPNP